MPVKGSARVEAVAKELFAEQGTQVYAVLDGASVNSLLEQLYEDEPDYECLYRGDLEPDIAEVAPYLVLLEEDSAFTEWVLREGWGKHWGIFAISNNALPDLRRHFRRFLTVHTAEGNPLLFRYYDPRVLRTYLPTCNGAELETLFGPVLAYIQEGEQPAELLRFEKKDGALSSKKKSLPEED